MNLNWKEFLARQGLSPDAENFAAHVGDPAAEHMTEMRAELRAARESTIVVPIADQGVIRASGEEAAGFLHNLLTNDVKNIPADGARLAALCTAKGRMMASFLIWREGADYLLQLSADILPAIQKKLTMYVLRSKVKISDASLDRVLIGLAGPQAETLLGSLGAKPGAAMGTATFDGGIAIRLDAQRFVLAVTAEAAESVWTKLSATAKPAGMAAWRLLEIAAGQPRIVAATQEAFTPQMVNYELPAVGGVNFQKGCYPGQEIVARTQYLGKVKRRMYRAKLDTAFPPGTSVFTTETGEQHCGTVVCTAPAPIEEGGGFESLLVVQSSGMEADAVHVGSPTGPKAGFQTLPYVIS